PLSADDSVAGCHVKVGHRQALNSKAQLSVGLFFDTMHANAVKIGYLALCLNLTLNTAVPSFENIMPRWRNR
ncbi:MAG: hypothetical protein PHR94_09290, partial [Methylomonas lenta]|nr:hypothetical protein [Methylomonas lenta]